MKMKDWTGHKFGRLTVTEKHEKRGNCNDRYWLCICDCGTQKWVQTGKLTTGLTSSCGCYMRECKVKHNMCTDTLYWRWAGMMQRCRDVNQPRYGGRGITVCDEWKTFKPFATWALANGFDESLQIDRIDNNGSYCPENCRFVTKLDNINNREVTRFVTWKNKKTLLADAAKEAGFSYELVYNRLREGWSEIDALTKPKRGSITA